MIYFLIRREYADMHLGAHKEKGKKEIAAKERKRKPPPPPTTRTATTCGLRLSATWRIMLPTLFSPYWLGRIDLTVALPTRQPNSHFIFEQSRTHGERGCKYLSARYTPASCVHQVNGIWKHFSLVTCMWASAMAFICPACHCVKDTCRL